MFEFKIDQDLSLKLIDLRDAKKIFQLTNKSRMYLREWLPWVDNIKELADTEEFVKKCILDYAENKSLHTAVLYKGEIVGVAGYNSINWLNKTADIGLWIGEEFQGHGIMRRIARVLTDYAINGLSLDKVELRVAAENRKSRRIAERLGFINEGCIRQAEWLYDHYVDMVVYGMLAEEWNEK